MTNKLTREFMQNIISGHGFGVAPSAVKAMAEYIVAAMDGEPVAEITEDLGRLFVKIHYPTTLRAGDKLYRHAQPTPERDQVRREHAEWSQATFGDVGPVGPLKHLSKEALEAAAEPDDLSEWADMQFLLWDAQRRAGITDEQITQAMTEKLAVNKQREWPEPKDGEPRLHIKEQPAPVVPPEQHWEELCRQHPDMSIGDAIIRAAWWNHCRTAMLQAAPVCTCPSGDGSLRWPCPVHTGNSPVIPDGLIAAVNRLLDNDGSRGCYSAIRCHDARAEVERLLAAAPQEVK